MSINELDSCSNFNVEVFSFLYNSLIFLLHFSFSALYSEMRCYKFKVSFSLSLIPPYLPCLKVCPPSFYTDLGLLILVSNRDLSKVLPNASVERSLYIIVLDCVDAILVDRDYSS